MATKDQKTQTASQAYEARRTEINALLSEIEEQVIAHGERQKSRPNDWGFAGDLGSVRERLTEIRDFMSPENVASQKTICEVCEEAEATTKRGGASCCASCAEGYDDDPTNRG